MDHQASQHTVNANWSTELNMGMGRLRSDHNGRHSHVEKRWLHIGIITKVYFIHIHDISLGYYCSCSRYGWDPASGAAIHLQQEGRDVWSRLNISESLNWPCPAHISQRESQQLSKYYHR